MRICQYFEITRTIHSKSERSEQFLVTDCFLTCSWRFLISNKLQQLEFKLENLLGFRNMQEKLENVHANQFYLNLYACTFPMLVVLYTN